MLTITHAQMRMFRELAWQNFRRRLADHVQGLLRDRGLSHDTGVINAAGVCEQVIDDCAQYGIERECDIARYAEIILKRGLPVRAPFSTDEHDILRAAGMSVADRLALLEDHIAAMQGG